MKIGIADTMFARADMAQFCIDVIKDEAEIERYTKRLVYFASII